NAPVGAASAGGRSYEWSPLQATALATGKCRSLRASRGRCPCRLAASTAPCRLAVGGCPYGLAASDCLHLPQLGRPLQGALTVADCHYRGPGRGQPPL
ncbi:hypothetical protein GW17_00050647, partial [Ensete ventricosum]